MRWRCLHPFRERDRWLRSAWTVGAVTALLAGMPATIAAAAEAECIVMPAIPGMPADSAAQPPKVDPELMRPMTEADLKGLIEMLEPVPLKEGAGIAIRAAAEGRASFPTARVGVLVADSVTLLAVLHARETLESLRSSKLDAALRRGLELDLRRIIGCGEGRFDSRGGAATLKTSFELVRKHREQLEPLLFDKLQPSPGRKDGPR